VTKSSDLAAIIGYVAMQTHCKTNAHQCHNLVRVSPKNPQPTNGTVLASGRSPQSTMLMAQTGRTSARSLSLTFRLAHPQTRNSLVRQMPRKIPWLLS